MKKVKKIKNGKRLEKNECGLKNNFFYRKKPLFFYFLLFTFCLLLAAPSFAQEEDAQMSAPPPLKTVSKEEKAQLKAETDVKKHTKLDLELMNARLTKAESYSSQEQYTPMFNELGGFHALIDDTLDYLSKHDTESGKVLNNFKRLEMSLRQFAPRLELIRRNLPSKYEPYLRNLIIYLRQARTKAVEPMFSKSVVSDGDTKKPR